MCVCVWGEVDVCGGNECVCVWIDWWCDVCGVDVCEWGDGGEGGDVREGVLERVYAYGGRRVVLFVMGECEWDERDCGVVWCEGGVV